MSIAIKGYIYFKHKGEQLCDQLEISFLQFLHDSFKKAPQPMIYDIPISK